MTELCVLIHSSCLWPNRQTIDEWWKWQFRLKNAHISSPSMNWLSAMSICCPTIDTPVACSFKIRRRIMYDCLAPSRCIWASEIRPVRCFKALLLNSWIVGLSCSLSTKTCPKISLIWWRSIFANVSRPAVWISWDLLSHLVVWYHITVTHRQL